MPRLFSLRNIGRLCWQSVAIILVVFALSVSLFRGLLPKLDQVRHDLADYVEQQYQVKVYVKELAAEWQAFGPALTVRHLVLPPQENLPITMIVDNVHVKLDFWQSLLSRSPQIENVIFEGVNVALDMDKLNQSTSESNSDTDVDAAPQATNVDWVYRLLLEQLERFSITDVTVQLNSQSGHQYRPIHINNLRWRNRGESHRGQGQLYLDKAASEVESLSLHVDVSGNGNRPDSLSGQIYLAAKSLDLGEWASRQVNPYNKKQALPLEGVVNLEAWLAFANRQITAANVAFHPSWLQWQLNGAQQKFELKSGLIDLSPTAKGWQLMSHDLAFATNGNDWPEFNLLATQSDGHLRASLNELDTSVLLPLLPLFPGMSLEGLNHWQAMSPTGQIKDLRLDYQPDGKVLFSAEGKQLAWQFAEGIPGSTAIDLQLGLSDNKLYISLPEQQYNIDFDTGFEAPIHLSGQAFSVKYALDTAELIAPKVRLENNDLKLDAAMKMQFADETYLSLAADVDVKNAANAYLYFPKHAMSEELVAYLTGAIKAGESDDAKVVWNGALADFPYADNSGVFQAGFSLKQARYRFQPDWPEVTDLSLKALFENASMGIWVDKGQLMDVAADGAYVGIPEMSLHSELEVKADLHTAGAAAKTVLLDSPLKDSVGATLQVVQVQGEVDGKLDLTIPLYEGGEEQIRGSVKFSDTPVYISEPGVQLTKVNGQVYFVNDVVTGEAIEAKLFEQPIKLSFDTGKLNKNYGLNVDLEGQWQLDTLPESLDNPLKGYYQGTADWQGALSLIFDPIGYRIQAQVHSDLAGVSLTLPGAFAKAADSKRDLSIELIGDNKQSSLGAKLGDQFEFWGGFNEQSEGKIAHYDLLLGRTFKPGDELQRDKGHLQLDLPATDLAEWLPIITGFIDDIPSSDAVLQQHESAVESAQANSESDDSVTLSISEDEATVATTQQGYFPPLVTIDGQFQQLMILGLPMNQLNLHAYPTDHGWRFEGQAQEFDGRVDLYPNWSTQGIKIVAKRLAFSPQFKASDEAKFSSDTVLSNLPPLAVDVDEFSVEGKALGHLVLQGTPVDGDYHIQTVSLDTQDSRLNGKGAWFNNDGQNLTELELDLKVKNFDEISERLGLGSGLREAPLDLQANLSWSGAPYDFALDTLNGKIDYKLGKGHLSEVSDKGARIFSLFSLDSLLRKLSLDFSDVFGKGLYFDSFDGTLNVDNGVMKTTNSEMQAVAGNMKVRGYTDLTTESLNYDIRFVPKLASSVPTVVLLSTGGWTLGLGAFALTKVLEPVIEVISEIRFRLTGTMSEPKLEELERKSKEIEIPESALPEHLRKPKAVPEATPMPENQPQTNSGAAKSTTQVEPVVQAEVSQVEVQQAEVKKTKVDQPLGEVNAAGVELPNTVVETPMQFNESVKPLQQATQVKKQAQPTQNQDELNKDDSGSNNGRDNEEQGDAGKLITMSEWSRCQSQPQLYQRAA
ncbi:YhdP family protein [Shewanella sp. Isolate11]|uniref:YhdP family protein n=1 Tax=Shewanella sp. Isolate11 TaxID=2908530 RepID=UPI001EFCDB35|nr:TIGR02099 family protein [Shewanella sp. Isolate11]